MFAGALQCYTIAARRATAPPIRIILLDRVSEPNTCVGWERICKMGPPATNVSVVPLEVQLNSGKKVLDLIELTIIRVQAELGV